MQSFGWFLFVVGALALIVAAFVGIDSGIGRVTNLAGLTFGSTVMICGAVLASVGAILDHLRKSHEEMRKMIGVPEGLIPDVKILAHSSQADGKAKIVSWSFDGKAFDTEEDAKKAREEYVALYGKKGA